MDNYWDKDRFSRYFLTLANLEAQQLYSKATEAAFIHLKDGFTQVAFQDEVKRFIDAQLDAIRSASSEIECQQCLRNLQDEHKYLSLQDQMLRSGEAALHASVQFIKNDKVWHWVINGVGVVLGGMQVVAGLGVAAVSFATGNVIGTGFGAMLILHGANGVVESSLNLFTGKNDAQGFLRKFYIGGAEFFGFDQRLAELAYTSMDLLLSVYGMARLIIKPQQYRLFHYLSTDYVRGIKDMSRLDLGIEAYNDTLSIKTLYDDINSG